MVTVSGLIYKDGEFQDGSISVDEEGYFEMSPSRVQDADFKGLVIPTFSNCHMHIGDSAVPKPPPGTIEDIVGPPDGYKHRMLRQVSDEDMIEAMSRCIERMEKAGIGRFLDFREGGAKGARQLLEALDGKNMVCDIYSRPGTNTYDPGEVDELLSISAGLGISAISDWNLDELRKVADHVHRKRGSLALHASERVREDIDQILDMKPKFLVHMIKASGDDLALCAENDVPIVICPRANSFFGLEPPVKKMVDAGVNICLGTDNVMLAEPDMFSEMRFLRGFVPADVLSSESLLNMVFDNCRKVLNQVPNIGVEPWGHDGFIVLDRPFDNPANQVMDATPDDICFIWKSGGN